eukprot:scaffold7687_cov127-Isochrysis_galbana.AAC.1
MATRRPEESANELSAWAPAPCRVTDRSFAATEAADQAAARGQGVRRPSVGTLCYGCSASGSLAGGVSSDTLS